jgi:inorganic pyrophosphatase/GNAT superfamily N-acetyltransferase
MRFKVFIENQAGSSRKNHDDEKTLMFQRSETVSRAYPFPYGFIIGTSAADGDCLDCFVISERALRIGEVVECEAIGLMEQTEDGLSDHNVLAQLVGERAAVTAEVRATLADFVQNVFSHIPGKAIGVGRFLGVNAAETAIEECRVPVEVREEPISTLPQHAEIPIAFTVERVCDIEDGPGGFAFTERVLDAPYVKDYDEHETPMQWATRFDVSKWGLLSAFGAGQRVGGAVVAVDTPGLNLLHGRTDLALLWDIRVGPEYRKGGIGSALFRAVEGWARARGCRELKVETQNVNVPACRFYQRQGCHLTAVYRDAYPLLSNEIQLLWSKRF